MKRLLTFLSVFGILFFVSCSLGKNDGSIYDTTDKNNTKDEDNIINDDQNISDDEQQPDNTGLPDDEKNDTPDSPDIDSGTDDGTEEHDDVFWEGCGNGEIEDGEICELGSKKSCVELEPVSFTGGDAFCNEYCTAWDMSKCESSCEGGVDDPDENFIDLNCDGIDGTIADSIFVDRLNGNDTHDGSKEHPVSSISKGIEKAELSGKKHVLVGAGTFNETIHLKSGISIHGAYSGPPEWERNISYVVKIMGGFIGMICDSEENVTLSFIRIVGANNFSESGTSIGVKLKNCSEIFLNNVKIESGHGGDGKAGVDGAEGSSGGNGNDGSPGCGDTDEVFCNSCSRPAAGSGGTSSCGAGGGNGGRPGNGVSDGDSGGNGAGSTNNGGSGGNSISSGNVCTFDINSLTNGKDGNNGNIGEHGTAGSSFGGYNDLGYILGNGGNGVNGGNGIGGGGGGGGRGGSIGCDSYGSSGGGGGAGGCAGTAGTAGTGGGASIGIWAEKCTEIDLVDVEIATDDGGRGGAGGTGKAGGTGGLAGDGGSHGGSGQEDGGCGGYGGKGGDGGSGGSGGGGGGGPSIGIIKIQSSFNGMAYANYLIAKGGQGGSSTGNAGETGKSGPFYELE